jgi:tRNA pseudouridine38-40 synthase
MARYQIILAYDGTQFLGFQRQHGKYTGEMHSRTVQGEFETALKRLGWNENSILAAGRTDTGVHASGQVVAFDLIWNHSEEELANALNAWLPSEMAVRQAKQVREDFHPRFDASSRRYTYRVFSQPKRNPLRERFAWRVYPEPDLHLLRMAAQLFLGTHDFKAFGSPPGERSTTIRTVIQSDWRVIPAGDDQEIQFEVEANAFLYRMVRRMTYLQLLVGQKKLGLEELERGVVQQRTQPAGLAPACGLVLAEVKYMSEKQE